MERRLRRRGWAYSKGLTEAFKEKLKAMFPQGGKGENLDMGWKGPDTRRDWVLAKKNRNLLSPILERTIATDADNKIAVILVLGTLGQTRIRRQVGPSAWLGLSWRTTITIRAAPTPPSLSLLHPYPTAVSITTSITSILFGTDPSESFPQFSSLRQEKKKSIIRKEVRQLWVVHQVDAVQTASHDLRPPPLQEIAGSWQHWGPWHRVHSICRRSS